MADIESENALTVSPMAPNSGLTNGQRGVGDDERLAFVARRLAARFWRGGGDEAWHFLLWMCADVTREVWAGTEVYDGAKQK